MLVTVIRRQNRLTWLPNQGMVKGSVKITSGAARFLAHRNDSPLSSMHDGKNQNMAMSIGICNSMGTQPEKGLAPARE